MYVHSEDAFMFSIGLQIKTQNKQLEAFIMKELIQQYKQSLAKVRLMYEQAPEEDKKIISGMISDLQYSLEWMQTARMPGNRRGVERLAAYQREKSFDPLIMQQYFRSMDDDPFTMIDRPRENVTMEMDRFRIENALSVLTNREREVYLMSRGHCLSFEKIAGCLGITKSSVQTMIKRAEKKIAKQISQSQSPLSFVG